jgi:hypothetical protein
VDVGEDVRIDFVGLALGDGEVIDDDVSEFDLAHGPSNSNRRTP